MTWKQKNTETVEEAQAEAARLIAYANRDRYSGILASSVMVSTTPPAVIYRQVGA